MSKNTVYMTHNNGSDTIPDSLESIMWHNSKDFMFKSHDRTGYRVVKVNDKAVVLYGMGLLGMDDDFQVLYVGTAKDLDGAINMIIEHKYSVCFNCGTKLSQREWVERHEELDKNLTRK